MLSISFHLLYNKLQEIGLSVDQDCGHLTGYLFISSCDDTGVIFLRLMVMLEDLVGKT